MRRYREMRVNADDVRRILKQVHRDITIDFPSIQYVLHLVDYTKNTRPFPGRLETYAHNAETKAGTMDQDILDKARQEYLLAEVLELSSNAASDRKKSKINMFDVKNAIRSDNELMALFGADALEFV